MILFMSALVIFVCPEYIIIGCLINTILEKEVDKLFPMKYNMGFYDIAVYSAKTIALWPVIILYYAQERIKEFENAKG